MVRDEEFYEDEDVEDDDEDDEEGLCFFVCVLSCCNRFFVFWKLID